MHKYYCFLVFWNSPLGWSIIRIVRNEVFINAAVFIIWSVRALIVGRRTLLRRCRLIRSFISHVSSSLFVCRCFITLFLIVMCCFIGLLCRSLILLSLSTSLYTFISISIIATLILDLSLLFSFLFSYYDLLDLVYIFL